MAIRARRIPHGLEGMGYLPVTTVPAHTVRGGLGGAESCGPNQKWDPNYVFQGIKGQCVPSSQPLVQMAQPSPSWFDSFMSAFSTPQRAPAAAPMPVAPASSGVSTTTIIAVGVGVLALVLLATRE